MNGAGHTPSPTLRPGPLRALPLVTVREGLFLGREKMTSNAVEGRGAGVCECVRVRVEAGGPIGPGSQDERAQLWPWVGAQVAQAGPCSADHAHRPSSVSLPQSEGGR